MSRVYDDNNEHELRRRVEKRFSGGARIWQRWQYLAIYFVVMCVIMAVVQWGVTTGTFGYGTTYPANTWTYLDNRGVEQSVTQTAWTSYSMYPFWQFFLVGLGLLFFIGILNTLIAMIRETNLQRGIRREMDLEMVRLQIRLEQARRGQPIREDDETEYEKPKRGVLLSADGELIDETEHTPQPSLRVRRGMRGSR